MLSLDGEIFKGNTILDIVLYPDMSVAHIIPPMIENITGTVIILDTQGNLGALYGSIQSDRGSAPVHRNVISMGVFGPVNHGMDVDCFTEQSCSNFSKLLESAEDLESDVFYRISDAYNHYSTMNSGEITDKQNISDVLGDAQEYKIRKKHKTDENSGENYCNTTSTLTRDGHVIETDITNIMASAGPYDIWNSESCPEDVQRRAIEYQFMSSADALLSELDRLRNKRDFLLVIDTVTFLLDSLPSSLPDIVNRLWALVYESNATIMTINHYKIARTGEECHLLPRMGQKWAALVSYQLLFRYNGDDIVFTVQENSVLNNLAVEGDAR